jgi:hypothetical protein
MDVGAFNEKKIMKMGYFVNDDYKRHLICTFFWSEQKFIEKMIDNMLHIFNLVLMNLIWKGKRSEKITTRKNTKLKVDFHVNVTTIWPHQVIAT